LRHVLASEEHDNAFGWDPNSTLMHQAINGNKFSPILKIRIFI